jgi:hypothetical protein
MIGATELLFMPFFIQYFEKIQTESGFAPLLELQAAQQRVMFSRVMIFASLIICSQEAIAFREPLRGTTLCNLTPQ